MTDQSERNRQIVEMAKGCTRPRDIAIAFGMRETRVYQIISKARSRGEAIPLFTTHGDVKREDYVAGTRREILVPVACLEALRNAAAKRGIGMSTLAAMIIQTVADEDLVNAVLDDQNERLFA